MPRPPRYPHSSLKTALIDFSSHLIAIVYWTCLHPVHAMMLLFSFHIGGAAVGHYSGDQLSYWIGLLLTATITITVVLPLTTAILMVRITLHERAVRRTLLKGQRKA